MFFLVILFLYVAILNKSSNFENFVFEKWNFSEPKVYNTEKNYFFEVTFSESAENFKIEKSY
jgi:hypothetical protein